MNVHQKTKDRPSDCVAEAIVAQGRRSSRETMQTILIIIAALLPQTAIPVAHVEAVELNHVVRRDENGDWVKRLDQLVIWGSYPGETSTFVREWIFCGIDEQLDIDGAAGLVILDGRVFKARVLAESWTDYDVEVEDRGRKPECERLRAK